MAGLNLQQGQRLDLVHSPQQILVSSLLQLPMMLLEQRIKTELVENPLLEETEEWEDDSEDAEEVLDDKQEEEIGEELKEIEDNSKSEEDKLSDEVQEDFDLEDILPGEDEIPEIRQKKDPNEEERDMPEPYVFTMAEHLIDQLQLMDLSPKQFEIGEYLIHNLRDDGYLDGDLSLDTVAMIFEVKPEMVEKILKVIQRLDPNGVGARNLQECLQIQLEMRNGKAEPSVALRIIRDFYEEFSNRRFEKLGDLLGADIDDIKDALAEISTLNPKPGEGLSDVRLNYIIPDFVVEQVDGELVISLNDYKMPGLRISHHYKKMIRNSKKLDKEVKHFLRNKMSKARFFIEAIRQRQNTMQRTMEAIVEKQEDFFRKGPEFIKPMIMKDVAELIEMDISTVSRVCKGKYVETDFGVFELKYFFNEGMETEDGEDISTLRIKERLSEIINNEDKKKPLSDEKISQILHKEGVPIARRTVAKYREQLDIPKARFRRGI